MPGEMPPAVACPYSQPAYDVKVVIDAQAGPNGGTPLALSHNLFSMNIGDWMAQDFTPTLDPNFAAYLRALHPGLLRWPAGHTSQQRVFDASSTSTDDPNVLSPPMVDSFLGLCEAVGAQPYVGLNLKTGSAAQAAALVAYAHTSKHTPPTWWQMGNEPDNLDGLTQSASDYAAHYTLFSDAVRAVDPHIKLVGAELMTGTHVVASNDQVDWLTPILQQNGAQMDAIAWHYYPLDSASMNPNSSATPSAAHLLQENASDWLPAGLNYPEILLPKLSVVRSALAPHAQLWVDEMAEDSGAPRPPTLSDTMTGAVWAADSWGRFAENGADAMFHFLFHSVAADKFALLDENMVPRPEYYTYWMYAQLFGDASVQSLSSAKQIVAIHASVLQADGSLRVLLVNKSAQAQRVQLEMGAFAPQSAVQYVLETDASQAAQLNHQTLTPATVAAGPNALPVMAAPVCSDPILVMPPMSVLVAVFGPHRP